MNKFRMNRRRPRRMRDQQAFTRLRAEPLEERRLLTVFTVVNVNDAGAGSLRDAITQANANTGADTINFKIPLPGVQTISPLSQLPVISDPLTINGLSQGVYAGQPLIELNGSLAGNTAYGLEFLGGGNVVQGLNIHSFAADGILFVEPNGAIATGNNVVFEDFIGTDPTGKIAEGNQEGIHLINSPHDVIEGNLISGNTDSGIFVADRFSTDTHIDGNMIGTDVTGLKPLGNGVNGVALGAPPTALVGEGYASGNFVGGALPVQRNIISGNGQSGIWIKGGTSNVVQGNYIGVGADGLTKVANGVTPNPTSATFGIAGVFIQDATDNVIGGSASGAGNVIAANTGDGVQIIAGSTGNDLLGNYIGTNATGEAALPNANGVSVIDSYGNNVGGATSGSRNIISGNKADGVYITDTSSDGPDANAVFGNIIGLDATGLLPIPNQGTGVEIDSSNNNTIGGTSAAARNVISANRGYGIDLESSAGNVVAGNFIGTDVSGLVAYPNLDGVDIVGGSYNVIGGTTAGARNVISGNGVSGIDVSFAIGTVVEGNYIGTDSTGQVALRNALDGVEIFGGSANLIGGTTAAARNIISGNGFYGIEIKGAPDNNSTSTVVEGNYIGTDVTGEVALANGQDGVSINSASLNVIGGAASAGSAPRNVISGNTKSGIVIDGTSGTATGNSVLGNLIGLDALGEVAVPNAQEGVFIDNASANSIGNGAAGGGNVISGNGDTGIDLSGTSANNVVSGNYVGTDVSGLFARANATVGVILSDASSNTIGGTTAAARNVISGNAQDGLVILGQTTDGATGNVVEGNYIGTDVTGEAVLPNGQNGVSIYNASRNTIGGSASPAGAPPGNVISGNKGPGIVISGQNGTATDNSVLGNLIGLDQAGIRALANGDDGVLLIAAASNVIGDGTASGRNIISGNLANGVTISAAGATDNTVSGNYIGTDISGTSAVPNQVTGVFINNVPNNTIGGSAFEPNVISGNNGPGLYITGANASGNKVFANFIGTDAVGAVALPNQGDGLLIDGAPQNIIGIATVGQINIISGNKGDGIELTGAGAINNQLQQNFIGTDPTATIQEGNQKYGIEAHDGAANNTIGGTLVRQGNTIAYNGASLGAKGYGVEVPAGAGNAIRANSIFNNAGRGIDLVNLANPDTFTINDSQSATNPSDPVQDAPVVTGVHPDPNNPANTVITFTLNSTPNTSFAVDFFSNKQPSPSGFGDGQKFVSTDVFITDANGNRSIGEVFHPGETFISATATSPSGNTSEFSMVDSDADGLADTWETRGIDLNEDGTVDLTLPGANPYHKDVYVEIDSIAPFEPYTDALNQVVDAFKKAPVSNPDGSTGIALHLQNDETMPNQNWIGDLNGDGVIDSFDLNPFNWFAKVKANGIDGVGGFGTAEERQNPVTLAAKALAYRYVIFADQIQLIRSDDPGVVSYDTSGLSEFDGNDIIVSLGGWGQNADTIDNQAGTFMHELGHSLGLDHGGDDGVNFKPNYQSVMNYEWQVPAAWMYEDANRNGVQDYEDLNGNGVKDPDEPFTESDINGNGTFGDTTWSLNYSSTPLDPLNEKSLSESKGIGGIPGDWEIVGPNNTRVLTTGPVDWNGNGAIDTNPVTTGIDLNNDKSLSTLTGFDDWSNLQYFFGDTGDAAGGTLPPDDGLTLEQWEAINAEGPGSGVLEFQSTMQDVSEGDGQAVITVIRGAGTTGNVTVDYATANGTAEAGSDFTPVSGTLTFAPGEYVKTITVPIIDDNYAENTETFSLKLSHATGGAEIRQDASSATLNIHDNDTNTAFIVTNTNDSGPGSLRQAITDANSHPGDDLIDFNIGAGGVQTIVPLSQLPEISDPVTIDGTSQPGFAGKPIIELDGENVPGGVGLVVAAANTEIRGLVINRFAGSGIGLYQGTTYAAYNFDIAGNYLGTDVTGTVAEGNQYGILVFGGSGTIGGTSLADRNVISGNLTDGIYVNQDYFLSVEGNLIGVAADGTSPLGNAVDGVRLDLYSLPSIRARNVTIGGLDPSDGNVIAFNQNDGIEDTSNGAYSGTPNLSFAANNLFLSNLIYANQRLGISENYSKEYLRVSISDDGIDGQDLNDASSYNEGVTNPQNYPVLASALSSGGETTISGYLDSRPYSTLTLQFFSNPTVTASGYGQGKTLLGTITVQTDGSGHVDFTADLDVSVANGQLVTATATGYGYGTSDFSERIAVGDVLGNVYVVNTTDDTDDGAYNPAHVTLRDAILAANAHPGLDTIEFAIGSGVQTIAPLTALPVIIDSVIIDGTTQPGYAGTPLVQIVGTQVEQSSLSGSPAVETGLFVNTNGCTVKGLDINSFFEPEYDSGGISGAGLGLGIVIDGNDNVLEGCFLGTDVTGTVALPNLHGGQISGGGNRIGGTTAAERNIISGNVLSGLAVAVFDTTTDTFVGASNLIEGNYVGTDLTGTMAVPNGQLDPDSPVYGLAIGGPSIVGGAAPGAGNIISGNMGTGLSVYDGEGSVIQGNFIGTDVTGTKKLGNLEQGIYIVVQTDTETDPGILIGGRQPGEGNIVSNNGASGIVDYGFFDVIQGNLIGTDITGTLDFGNGTGVNDPGFGLFAGIIVTGSNVAVGGSQPGAGNLISGNVGDGIYVAEGTVPSPTSMIIQGNRIGTQADGVSPLGNGGDGVNVQSSNGDGIVPPGENVIGGLDPGDGNIIAFNGRDGVELVQFDSFHLLPPMGILSNSIYSNGALGIDLGGNGVTPNDPNDTDTGANNLQNFPVLATVVTDGVHSTITGSFNSTPNTVFQLQFFSSAAADPSGFGEGQNLLGTRLLTTDSHGHATFVFSFPVALSPGQAVSATATDALQSATSEFSAVLQLAPGTVAPNQPPTVSVGGPYTINEGDSLTLNSFPTDDPDGDPLTYSWDINGDGVFGDATGANPTLSWAQLQALGIVNGPSSFNVNLRVDDGQGHVVTSAATSLTVLNVAPIVSAGDDQYVAEEDLVTLTGSFTDPGTADTHTLNWHVDADNGQVIADGSGSTFSFVPDDNGTYVVTFNVTDSDGATGSSVVNVYVYDANPVATMLGVPAQGTVSVPINLNSTVTDVSPVDTAAGFQYDWEVFAEDNNDEFFGSSSDFSFTPTGTGTYDIYLLVQDKDGGYDSLQQSVVVTNNGAGTAPTVTLGANSSINEGDTYTSSGSFLDPDAGDSWTATVNYGDGAGNQPLSLNSDQTFDLAHVYADNGRFDVVVAVTDSSGLTGTQTTHVTVNNVAPAVTLANPSPVAVDAVFSLAGAFTDPGEDMWTGIVNYGDGTGDLPLTLAANKSFSLSHTYQSAGSFNVAVTVTDDDGGAGTTTVTEVVNKLQTSLSAAPASATYGGTTTLSATLQAAGSPLSGKTLVFSLNGQTVGSAATNGNGTATLTNVSIGSLHAGSAAISVAFAEDGLDLAATATSTLSISKASLTITAASKSKVYGAALPTLTASYDGFVNGDGSSSLTTQPQLRTTATAASAVSGSPYPITASGASSGDYTITYVNGALTVTPASLVITAGNKSKVYGAALPTLTVSYAGFVNGDGVNSLTTTPAISTTATAGSHVAGNSYTITASGAVDGDYTLSYVPGSLSVTPVSLTVTADSRSKLYGAALPALTASYLGFVNGDGANSLTTKPTISTTAAAASHVAGNPYAITIGGAVDSDYTINYNAGTLTVTPAPLTITADGKTKLYGAFLPTLTASYSGFVNGDTAASLITGPALNTTATATSHVNTYPITVSGAVDADYTIGYQPGTLSVTPATLTITLANKSKAYGAALPTLTANLAGFVNGDTAASLTTQPALSTTATAASHVNSYPITASGAIDADYTFSYVAGSLSVTPVGLTVTAENKSKLYGATLPTLTASYAGFVNGDTAASLTTQPVLSTMATAASHVNTYPTTVSGAVDADYTIGYQPGTLSVTPAALTVTAAGKSRIYGAALPTLTASYNGFVNGDTAASLSTQPALSTTATAASHVNSYPITASGAVDVDYTIGYQPGTLSVTPATLTITLANKSKAYGAALPTLTDNLAGFVNGDTAASLTTQPVLSTTATAASHVNSYPITASSAVDADYTFSYVAGSLSVTPVGLTVAAENKSKLYGATLPTLTASYSGFVNGDTAASLTTQPALSTTATAASHVNTYPITVSGAVDADYTIGYQAGTLSVTATALTITAVNKSKVYGATLPTLTAGYAGFVNGDTASNLATQPVLSTTATASSAVATYPITASGVVDSNYTISYLPGSLGVTPAPLAIKADDKSKAAGAANPTLTFTPTGFVNGDTVSSLTTQPVLTTTATTSSAAGTYPITASGAASANYTISYSAGTLTVTSAAGGSISGKEYVDVTGNGLTADDTPLAAVKVYLDTNNNGSWSTGEPFATTLADGSYALTGLAAGTYKVREVVPTGYVRTAPATSDTYSVTLGSGQAAGGNNFANAQLGNPATLSNVVYVINGTSPVSDLRGATHEGDTIQVSFTVVAGTQPQRFTLASYTAPGATYDANTAAQQQIFDSDSGVLGPGTYTLTVSNPHSYFQVDFVSGYAIDKLGPAASNIFYTAQNRLFSADNGGTHAVRTSPASLTGTVYLDSNNNGNIDAPERPIAGVTVTVTCGSAAQSVVTDMYGAYTFDNLQAGAYTIAESQPSAYSDGKDTIGNKGGTASNDKFSGINLAAGAVATGYNFGEQQTVGSAFAGNQTQTIAWWNGSNGQALIKALNSGQNSTNLGNWLASNFNNLFGAEAGSANNLAGKTNAQVAAYYQSLYSNAAKKPEADALALALNIYVTNSNLAGNTAASYGFAVSSTGLGGSTANVGAGGAAFGINNNTVMTIAELLSRANERARKGTLWDANGDGVLNSAESILRNQVFSLFDTIINT